MSKQFLCERRVEDCVTKLVMRALGANDSRTRAGGFGLLCADIVEKLEV
jgi:hypothetical protein